MLQLLLRVLNVLSSSENVSVLSEVWHFVANSGWMIRLISSLSWGNIASFVHAGGWLLLVMLLLSFWWGTSWWSWIGTLWLQLLSFLVIWNLLKSILGLNSINSVLFNLNSGLSIGISSSSLLGLGIGVSSGRLRFGIATSSVLWLVLLISFTLGKRWGILILLWSLSHSLDSVWLLIGQGINGSRVNSIVDNIGSILSRYGAN